MYSGQELSFMDLSGGQASNVPSTLIKKNQALVVKNVFATPGGGIEQRRGDTAFNASAMVSGATAVTGLYYMKFKSATETLLAIAGTKLFKSDSLSGTMTDITGAITITTGQNNIWDFFAMGDTVVGVGGLATSPDAPFKYTGSGNAAALGGTPPSGSFGFQCNNRAFIGRTSANPSTVYWSILANAEDWSSAGSGSADIWTNDGDFLVGCAVLNTNIVLAFKQNSIHQMIVQTSPFPVFPMFVNVGAAGKHAIVAHEGLVYFITPRGRMKATDGNKIFDFPTDMDDVWDSLPKSRLEYIQGGVYQAKDHKILVWLCTTTGTTNDVALVWDLTHQSWWRFTTGYKANVMAKSIAGTLYAGHYDGKIYSKDTSAKYTDDSESAGTIGGRWESGWNTENSLQTAVHPFRLNVSYLTQSMGNLRVGYGFDFSSDRVTTDLDMTNPGLTWDSGTNDGGEWDAYNWADATNAIKNIFIKGRGNAFQITFCTINSGETFRVNHFTVSGKPSGQKVFSAK